MRQYKQYKESSPEKTIERIRQILSDFGIHVKEVKSSNSNNTFFAAHLHICNDGLLPYDLSTNGKGTSPAYALASAYGELMERFQSGILFKQRSFLTSPYQNSYLPSRNNNLKFLKYYFAPDEIISHGNEYKELIHKYIQAFDINEIQTKYINKFEILLPFYNVINQNIEYIPQRILEHSCGSNGMCAGNTPHEAILQGLCEIFERYALRKLYLENLTPPDIPIEHFKGHKIYDYIHELESTHGFTIKVKDCSIGLNLPVIGVLIIDSKSNCYDFHLGADPVPHIALERVFTELYQNATDLNLKPIDFNIQSLLISDLQKKEEERVKYSFQKNTMPISIFGDKPSYYSTWYLSSKWGQSNETDLAYAISLLKNLGFSLYVRDVSFLGFPSYIVYIPGMSELINIESMRWFNATFEKIDYITNIAHHLPSATIPEIKDLLAYVSKFNEPEYLKFFNTADVWNVGNPLFVLGILALFVSDYKLAIKYLSKVITPGLDSKLKRLYSLFLDYAFVINNSPNYLSTLSLTYSKEELDLLNSCITGEWRKLFNLTSCFNCNECRLYSNCSYKAYSELLHKRERLYESNIIDQNRLIQIFNFKKNE